MSERTFFFQSRGTIVDTIGLIGLEIFKYTLNTLIDIISRLRRIRAYDLNLEAFEISLKSPSTFGNLRVHLSTNKK